MRSARRVLALAGAAVFALSACGSGSEPDLMQVRTTRSGPDEFSILPPKSLSMPKDMAALPEPTPGGSNLTDPTPEADAIVALGGKPQAPGVIPAADNGLRNYATRKGVTPTIRQELASEDLEYRKKNRGRVLPRLFSSNLYYKAYEPQSLDRYAELERWRKRGVKTPSAPEPELED